VTLSYRVGLFLAGALVLSACQTIAPAQQEKPATKPPLTANLAPVDSPPKTMQPATPERLIGLGEDKVVALFGPPSLKRKETGAELWQFADPACVMDFYFYTDGEAKKVSYVSLRDPVTGRVGGNACQDQLAKLSAN
jgi:hypothetical protein